jgi:hypothetical protein
VAAEGQPHEDIIVGRLGCREEVEAEGRAERHTSKHYSHGRGYLLLMIEDEVVEAGASMGAGDGLFDLRRL